MKYIQSIRILSAVVLLAVAGGATLHAESWPVSIEGFVAPKPGEHPRLLFRKDDVADLRAKAKTAVGKAMIERLKYLLGGGEAMPTEFNPNPPLNIGPKGPAQLKPGAFTVNHAAGFGLLYQLTGEKKYADLARKCLDKVFEGQVDRDERYSWTHPGTGFRLSGVLQGVSIAYDLCYDGWDEEYRREVAKEIQTNAPRKYNGKGGPFTLEELAKGSKYPPSSNHYGAYLSGPGFAALALKGDPGADDKRLEKILKTVESSMRTVMTRAYGDRGWFGEGTGSDKTACFPGLVGLMQSMRIAHGKDWCEGAPNGRHVILTRALELTNAPDMVARPPRGLYAHGTDSFYGGRRATYRDSGGWSSDGLFSIGLGALPDRYKPGMKWIYQNFVEPDTDPTERIYEARIDPLHAVYAFVNWPLDVEAENPEKAFPLAIHDSVHGYVLARSGFSVDRNEVLFTGLCRKGPTGYHKTRAPQDVWVWFRDYRIHMGQFSRRGISNWKAGSDGSAMFTNSGNVWAIDYSGAAGCEGAIAAMGRVPIHVKKLVKADKVPDDKIDLSGKWSDGVTIEQDGKTVTATTPKGWKTATGTLEGRTIKMRFGAKGKIKLTGRVSPGANTIDWSNGYTWKRRIKTPRWKYAPGEKVKVSSVKSGRRTVTIVTFAVDGEHPEPKVDGNTIQLGKQRIELDDGRLVLKQFRARK
jgi:hypothetical protein